MNRLILIGNGFDLSHKLKTSYSDFIKDYISCSINCFFENKLSSDPLLDIRYKYSGHTLTRSKVSTPISAIKDLEDLTNHDFCKVNIKSKFLSDTLKRLSDLNWVDLENAYFDQLLSLKIGNTFQFDKVKELNDEFEFLRSKLESYLMLIQGSSDGTILNKLTDLFCETIKSNDIVTVKIDNSSPSQILLLSFNYTNTLEKYREACLPNIYTEINYIHGELNSNTNPVIFGFGDEFNKNYLEFEELGNKELLKHIKSFGYFKTNNYHNLIRFIDKEDFQVFIFGHSLGLSDRTMLKQIFEHEKCKSIKIFYHQISEDKNDYTEKTFDISSHFSNKGLMRKLIVPFSLSVPMPQLK